MGVSSFSVVSPDSNLLTGTLSPVNEDSFIRNEIVLINRESAGILSPWAILIMSPGTTSSVGISISFPSRITRASGAASF